MPATAALLRVRQGSATLVAGSNAKQSLASLTDGDERRDPSPRLRKLAEGAPPASLALYADLALLRPQSGFAPVLAVLGKQGSEALFELELSAPACAALVERLGSP